MSFRRLLGARSFPQYLTQLPMLSLECDNYVGPDVLITSICAITRSPLALLIIPLPWELPRDPFAVRAGHTTTLPVALSFSNFQRALYPCPDQHHAACLSGCLGPVRARKNVAHARAAMSMSFPRLISEVQLLHASDGRALNINTVPKFQRYKYIYNLIALLHLCVNSE